MIRIQYCFVFCFLASFFTVASAGTVRDGRTQTEIKSCDILLHKRKHTAHICDAKTTPEFDQSEAMGLGTGVDVFSANSMFKGREIIMLHAGNSEILGKDKVYCRHVHGAKEEKRYIPNTVEYLLGNGCGDSEAKFDVISTTNSDMNLVSNKHGVSGGVSADDIPIEEGVTIGFGFGGTSGESNFLQSKKASEHDQITSRHLYRRFCLQLNIDAACYKKDDLADGFMMMIDAIELYVKNNGDTQQLELTEKIEDLFDTYGNHFIHKVPYGGFMEKKEYTKKSKTSEVSLKKSKDIAKAGFDVSLFGAKILDTTTETDDTSTTKSTSFYSNKEFSSNVKGLPSNHAGETIGNWENRVIRAPVAIRSEIVLKEIWKLPHIPKLAKKAIAKYYTKKLKRKQNLWKSRHTFEVDCACKWLDSKKSRFTWSESWTKMTCPPGSYQQGSGFMPSWGSDEDSDRDDWITRSEFKDIYIHFKIYCCPLNCEL